MGTLTRGAHGRSISKSPGAANTPRAASQPALSREWSEAGKQLASPVSALGPAYPCAFEGAVCVCASPRGFVARGGGGGEPAAISPRECRCGAGRARDRDRGVGGGESLAGAGWSADTVDERRGGYGADVGVDDLRMVRAIESEVDASSDKVWSTGDDARAER